MIHSLIMMRQPEKPEETVRDFYDQVGWKQGPDGTFADALLFEDLKDASRTYIHQCHLRVNRYLETRGRFLLDVASGPIQYPEYLTYSRNFARRLCVDISALALAQARDKLGSRGLYVLADITDLPFKDNSLDGVISLHTIYHVPEHRQERAFAELYRVLRPGTRAVVVYSWGSRALLMRLALFPLDALKFLLKPFIKWLRRQRGQAGAPLYFHAHGPGWFERKIRPRFPCETYVWRSVSVDFLKMYIHRGLGEKLLFWIYRLEEKYPRFLGRVGQYPLIVFDKPRT